MASRHLEGSRDYWSSEEAGEREETPEEIWQLHCHGDRHHRD